MKKIRFLVLSIVALAACEKTYVCNCGATGGLPYKKLYMNAKTDNGAERKCSKIAESGESCTLQ